MARTLVSVLTYVKVYKDTAWNEYVVELRRGTAAEIDRSSYHTTDKQDALDTAKDMDSREIARVLAEQGGMGDAQVQ